MWLIRKINDEGTIKYLISEKKCFTIGRQNSDIILSDSSISRTHCGIHIAPKKECPFPVQTPLGVWLVDKKSKYGTYILKNHEWVKTEPEKAQELFNGTVIRFGLLDNIWRLEYKPLIACTSKLSREQIQELKALLPSLDGKLVNKWVKQCTIVFVNDLTVTVKVLLALINGVPIVTINYLRQLVDNIKQNSAWPDFKLFKPEIAESTLIPHLVSLNVEDHRKELFKGKTFVIPTEEQLENLREIIVAAGGEAELLKLDGNCPKLAQENVIVIQLPCNQLLNPDDKTNSFKSLSRILKHEYHLRIVPETEIFQAIAYSSIEKYCNPKSKAFEIRQSLHEHNSCGNIIEESTPSQNNTPKRAEENGITISLSESSALSKLSEKDIVPRRKRNHSPEQEKSNKKLLLDESKKAKANLLQMDDDLNLFMNSCDDQNCDESKKEGSVSNILQFSESIHKNYDEKELFVSKFENTENFWNDLEKKETNSRKRKISENCNNETDFDQPEKRKRNLTDLHSENIFPHTGGLNTNASGSSEVNKENSFEDEQKNLTYPEFIDNTDGKWIRRKNANSRGNTGEKDCNALEWINKNSKNFKKKEIMKHQPIIEESFEEIGQRLMMEGWHRSRSSRIRTAAAS